MFGRAAIRISTGKLIEFQQGDAPLGTLTQNVVNAGIPVEDVEEKYVDEPEFQALLAAAADIKTQKGWKYLYINASTDAEKIDVIAQFLKLK